MLLKKKILEETCIKIKKPFLFAMAFETYGFMFNNTLEKKPFPTNINDLNFFEKFFTKKYPISCWKMLSIYSNY